VHGMIELYDPIQLETILKHNYDTTNTNTNTSSTTDIQLCEDSSSNSLLCLLLVPSFMIPRDILHHFNTYVSSIVSVHILRHSSDMEKYLALIMMESHDVARNLVADFNGHLLTSLEPTTCMIYFVKEVHAKPTINPTNTSATSTSSSLNLYNNHKKATMNEHERDTMIGFVGKTRSLSDLSMELAAIVPTPSARPKSGVVSLMRLSLEDQVCPVCLEPISEIIPQSFTTCCNHTFHIQCIYKTEGPQCPVCRFQHDSTPISLSQCAICSWSGEESERSAQFVSESNRDLWICLVCGFIGCGSSNCYHIRDHYQSHLHAYAMNVENGRVWDFAGDGYVHRLIMQQSDNDYDRGNDNVGLRASSAEERVQTKMVEIPDPRSRVSSRTRQAPLSTDEESLLVNRKLESTAFHYNQILTWQLETNRQQYEDRLRRFKDFLKQELQLASSSSTTNSSSSGSSNNNAKDNSKSWSQTVEELLLQEKTKALKKRDVAYGRLEDARAELRLLKDFNTSLGSNVADLHIAVAAAADKVSQAERVYSDFIPKLEKKVQALMERL